VEHQKLSLEEDERCDEGLELNDDDDDDDDEDENIRTSKSKSKSMKRPMIQESDSSSDESMPSQEEYMPRLADRYPKRNRPTARKENGRGTEIQQFRKIHSILNESQDYTLDARMQGNIGRFFNHSCDPNSMVQNVFIETHDLRFPVVAFFTKRNLKADDEINWHYNYKVDSIAGRQIPCNCGASNCQGRIL
jgi:histone-lysine N-methyltransferase SETDB1